MPMLNMHIDTHMDANVDMEMQHGCGHAARTWACSMDVGMNMDMQHRYVSSMYLFMLDIHVHTERPCISFISMYVLNMDTDMDTNRDT